MLLSIGRIIFNNLEHSAKKLSPINSKLNNEDKSMYSKLEQLYKKLLLIKSKFNDLGKSIHFKL